MQILPRAESKGFTLIEVLIAIALLAFISVIVYQATSRSFEVNKRLSSEADDIMGMSAALQAMEDDVSQIYTPLFPEPAANTLTGDLTPSLFWTVKLRGDGLRRARFLGTPEKMSFITNNNYRIQRGLPESEFLAVVWSIEKNDKGTYQLKRFSDTNAFDYDKKELDRNKDISYVIMDNLNSVQFSYYRKEGKKYEENWDSEGSAVKAGARYPEAIRIKLSGPDPTNPAVQMEWQSDFKPNFKINTATETKGNNALPETAEPPKN